jgi:hypothetical protein
MDKLKKNVDRRLIESTHPSFLTRIYALNLFSQSNEYCQWMGSSSKGKYSLNEIDRKIEENLEDLSGNERTIQNKEVFNSAYLWTSIYLFMIDGSFKDSEQQIFKKFFNDIDLNQLLSFLKIGKRIGLENKFNESLIEAASLEVELKEKLMYQIEVVSSYTSSNENSILKILSDVGNRLGIKRAVIIRENQ